MDNKLYRIWITFITNPSIWLMGGVAILLQMAFIYVICTSGDGSVLTPTAVLTNYGTTYHCSLMRRPPQEAAPPVMGTEPIPGDTVSLYLSNSITDPKVWEEIRNLPDLRSLETDWRDVSPVSELVRLESLSLSPSPPRPSTGGVRHIREFSASLPSLRKLVNLRELEVTSIPLPEVVEAVKEIPNLRTLVYHGNLYQGATSDELGRLAELKQLRVLAIGPHLTWGGPEALRKTLQPLANNPNLKILYLGGINRGNRGPLKAVRSLLPGVVVLSLFTTSARQRLPFVFSGGFLLFAVINIWILMVLTQTAPPFRYLGSALLPRYAPPHLLFAGLLLGISVTLNSGLLLSNGIPLLTALSLLLTPVGLFSHGFCTAYNPSPSPQTRRSQMIRMVIFLVIFFLIQFNTLAGLGPGTGVAVPRLLSETLWIEWIRFLHGFHPLVSISTLLLTIYLLNSAVQKAPTTYRRLLEAGVVDPDPLATQQMNTVFEAFGPQREGKLPWLWRPQGDEIEKSAASSKPFDPSKPLGMYTRTSSIPRRFWLLTALVPPIGFAVLLPFFQPNPPEIPLLVTLCIGLLSGLAVYCPSFLVVHWYSKGARLSQEILVRPVSRKVIVATIFRAIVCDTALWTASLLVIVGAVLCQFALAGKLPAIDPTSCFGLALLWGAFALLYIAYLLFAVTIRHGWLGAMFLGGAGIGFIALLIGAVFWHAVWLDEKITPQLWAAGIGCLFLIAISFASLAYRRLDRVEFG